MSRTNAERQRAYRDRRRGSSAARNGRNAEAGRSARQRSRSAPRDYYDAQGVQHIYLGDFGFGPRYATVVNRR